LKRIILKAIIKHKVDISDKSYKQSFKEPYKVNLNICGSKAYQIYEQNQYIYKYGELLEDPDVTIEFKDIDFAKKLYLGEKVKIPIFRSVVPHFGTSRLGKRLRDEPEYIDPVKEGEIEMLVKKMLRESVDISDEKYKENFRDQTLKVNWDVVGNKAYQIFEINNYTYKFGENLEDADLNIVINNPEYSKRFLMELPTNFAPGLDEGGNFLIYIKIPVISVKFKNPNESQYSLFRLPFFRDMILKASMEEKEDKRENYGHYVPVNYSLGKYENVVVPYKVFEYFINKASNIVLRTCPCREHWECKNYPIEIGCIFMGDDTKRMVLSDDQGRVATKGEALEHVRKAIDAGLIPLIGRNVAEAENGHGVKDTGHFLGGCFCCECCCIGIKTREYGFSDSMSGDSYGGMEGIKIKVDSEKCVGCGKCIEACAYKARKIIDGKAKVNPIMCVGCGRCVNACQHGATSIEIEDPDYIENFIAKIESIVDVTDQSIKN